MNCGANFFVSVGRKGGINAWTAGILLLSTHSVAFYVYNAALMADPF
jgi:hypothetical protein